MEKQLILEINRLRELMSLPKKSLIMELNIFKSIVKSLDNIIGSAGREAIEKYVKDALDEFLKTSIDNTIKDGVWKLNNSDLQNFIKKTQDSVIEKANKAKIDKTKNPLTPTETTQIRTSVTNDIIDHIEQVKKEAINRHNGVYISGSGKPKPDAGGGKPNTSNVQPSGEQYYRTEGPNGVTVSTFKLDDTSALIQKQLADAKVLSFTEKIKNKLGLNSTTPRSKAAQAIFDHLKRNKYTYGLITSILGGLVLLGYLYPDEPITQEEFDQAEDVVNDTPQEGGKTDVDTGGGTGGDKRPVVYPLEDGSFSTPGDPFQYRVRNGEWETKSWKKYRIMIDDWRSLKDNQAATQELDRRHPGARTKTNAGESTPSPTGEVEPPVAEPEISGEVNNTDPNNLP